MSSNGEMSDPDSSSSEPSISIEPAIAASVCPSPERVAYKCKEYIRNPATRAAQERMIEASECLKNWWDRGLIVQQPYVPEDDDSDACDLEENDCGL